MSEIEKAIRAAQGYHELGMPREALQELAALPRQVLERPEILEMRLLILMRARRWKGALTVSRKLCRVAPESPAGFIHAAFCLHEVGRTAEARDALLKGPPTLQREATYHYNLACYECALGELAQARAHLQTSFGLDKNFRDYARHDPDLQPLRGEW